jgi:hypothetical protein
MEHTTWTTSDLYLAAFLKAQGFIISLTRNGKKVLFSFEQGEDLQAQVSAYLIDQAQCSALAYANSIKNLKNLLYNL